MDITISNGQVQEVVPIKRSGVIRINNDREYRNINISTYYIYTVILKRSKSGCYLDEGRQVNE